MKHDYKLLLLDVKEKFDALIFIHGIKIENSLSDTKPYRFQIKDTFCYSFKTKWKMIGINHFTELSFSRKAYRFMTDSLTYIEKFKRNLWIICIVKVSHHILLSYSVWLINYLCFHQFLPQRFIQMKALTGRKNLQQKDLLWVLMKN